MSGTQPTADRDANAPPRRRDLPWRLIDAAVALALLLALGLVFALDRWSAGTPASENAGEAATTTVVDEQAGPATLVNPLRLAVTPPEFDDVGKLLDTLGAGYRYDQISMDDVLDPVKLSRYDVVFLTCGFAPQHWLGKWRGAAARNSDRREVRRPIEARIRDSLRTYLRHGGTLYASDWQFDLLKIAFPQMIDDRKEGSGAEQTVTADVLDAGLKHRLGDHLELKFDKPGWRPAAFKDGIGTVDLAGSYQTTGGRRETCPLMVEIPYEGGTIIFTSFHNEKQNSATELELLRALVFATVTAKTDAGIRNTMVRGGFSPTERNLLSASARNQALAQTYQCRGAKSLQFVLGFEARGAELRLAVVGPDGSTREQSGTSTFTIDVADPAAGQWKYTITPIKIPYQNFPFTLTVGEKP